jgi:broad specificity phosphatase PhoE
MLRIYIRHGEKAHSNGKSESFPFDPELTEKGKELVVKRCSLLLTYGLPTVIETSPFLRARETAQILRDNTKSKDSITIKLNDEEIFSSLRPETLEGQPYCNESYHSFKVRVKRFLKSFGKNNVNVKEVRWYITHGIVIKEIAKYHKYNISSNKINYLSILICNDEDGSVVFLE